MTRPRALPPFAETLLLLGLGLVAVQAALIPLGPGGALVPPDLLYCLVIAWVIRRPSSAPIWAVLALGLFADVMLSRPHRPRCSRPASRVRMVPGPPAPLPRHALPARMAAGRRLRRDPRRHVDRAFAGLRRPPGLATLLPYFLATAIAYPLIVLGLTWCLRIRAPHAHRFGNPLGRCE